MKAEVVVVEVPKDLYPIVKDLKKLYEKVGLLPDAKTLELMVHEELKEVDRKTMEVCVKKKQKNR